MASDRMGRCASLPPSCPPETALDDLAEFLDPRRDAGPDLRWTDPSLWHVTDRLHGGRPEPASSTRWSTGSPRRSPSAARSRCGSRVVARSPTRTRLGSPGWASTASRTSLESLAGLARAVRRACSHVGANPEGGAVHAAPHRGPLAPPVRGDPLVAGARCVCRPVLDRGRGHPVRVAPRRGQGPPALRADRRRRAVRLTPLLASGAARDAGLPVPDQPWWPEVVVGAPGRTRTCNLRIRRPLLYPLRHGGLAPHSLGRAPSPDSVAPGGAGPARPAGLRRPGTTESSKSARGEWLSGAARSRRPGRR